MTSTPRAAHRAWPRTAPPGRCTRPTTARCIRCAASSDNTTTNIGPLSAGGAANAATQDSFCSGTTCVITEIYDQTGHGNNLTDAPGGGAAGRPRQPRQRHRRARHGRAASKVYGVYIAPGDGYRDDSTDGTSPPATTPRACTTIVDGTHYNGGCCFDYGNAETNNDDDGAGTMEAVYFGNIRVWGFGSGNGPWIMADLENGLYSGSNAGLQLQRPHHQLPVHHRHGRRQQPATSGPSSAATPSPAAWPPTSAAPARPATTR